MGGRERDSSLSDLSPHLILEHICEGVRAEFVPVALVELVLELHPVKSQGV